MTDPNVLREDIAFVKALAEAGRASPIVNGAILLVAGLAFGTASLVNWVLLTHGWADWRISASWGASAVVFFGFLFTSRAMKPVPAGPARALGAAWSGAGWSIFCMGASLGVMSVRGHDAYVASAFLPFILTVYGSAWFVAAVAAQKRWLFAVAAGAFLMAVVNAWFAASGAIIYLVYALSLYALVAAPGAVLMRQARA